MRFRAKIVDLACLNHFSREYARAGDGCDSASDWSALSEEREEEERARRWPLACGGRREPQATDLEAFPGGGGVRRFPSPRRVWELPQFLKTEHFYPVPLGRGVQSGYRCNVSLSPPGVINTIAKLAKTCTLRLTVSKLYFILSDKVANGGVSMWCELCQVSPGKFNNHMSLKTRACSWV